MQRIIVDDLEVLLESLPPRIKQALGNAEDSSHLLEVIIDLGRYPEARFPEQEVVLSHQEVTDDDIHHVESHIGSFGDDNRAGINRTLHRISAIRNRTGKIVGLTCRVGRAVYGAIQIVEDLIQTGKSVLLLGRPGVGKTTMLREMARVLADDEKKRVVIVDTSNEIGGDGDIPHHAIGRARRMQVATPALQHAVMIEAVENHMPEVIIIDEMGTELEAVAARTIAERGVQLIATAHGNTLENLLLNPTLSDLVGGIQTVTLGDDEARRRRTQKTIMERKAPPTFDVVVEIQSWDRVAVHSKVSATVDSMLRGLATLPDIRWVDKDGSVKRGTVATDETKTEGAISFDTLSISELSQTSPVTRVHTYGVSRDKLAQVAQSGQLKVKMVDDIRSADLLLTTKGHYRRKPQALRSAEEQGTPVFVLRKNTVVQIQQFLETFADRSQSENFYRNAKNDAEEAAHQLHSDETSVSLRPQNSIGRRLQHQIAEQNDLVSRSRGREPYRHVTFDRR
jgi:stage III sporulation protein SpoIIIAA